MIRTLGMRVHVMVCAVVLLSCCSAFAWEFNVRGTLNWKYKYYSQLGNSGFFGPFDTDSAINPVTDLSTLNAWLGSEFAEGFALATVSSGSDAALSSMEMHLFPEFRINSAIRVRGKYRVGSWNDDVPELVEALRLGDIGIGRIENSHYRTAMFPGTQTSFSPGYWDLLWFTAQTPWGILAAGKRPFTFGCGLMFNGVENTSSESALLVVPYGPLSIGAFFYPWRQSPLAANLGSTYLEQTDKNDAAQVWVGGYLTYNAGSLSLGVMNQHVRAHAGPESQQLITVFKQQYIPADLTLNNGAAYAKYNNGRFFLNFEVDWYDETLRRGLNLTNFLINTPLGNGSRAAPSYIEHWRYMAETGISAGPFKLSLLLSHIPGPDRRAGVHIDRQPALLTTNRIFFEYNRELTSTGVFRPYSMIMSTGYGGGLNSIGKSRDGHMNDANMFGARLDYAVAANLNTYVSFFWAERASKGYGRGLIRPVPFLGVLYRPPFGPAGFGLVQPPVTALNNFVQTIIGGGFPPFPPISRPPAIPDSSLGFEINGGFDWKLFEGLTVGNYYGVWWPGKWFNYACVNKANPNGWFIASPGNDWGVFNPDREIDPVFAMELTLKSEF